MFDNAIMAQTLLERIIRTVENHLSQGSRNRIFSPETRELIKQEFHLSPSFLQRAVARSLVRIEIKNEERAHSTRNTLETAAVKTHAVVPTAATAYQCDSNDDLYDN